MERSSSLLKEQVTLVKKAPPLPDNTGKGGPFVPDLPLTRCVTLSKLLDLSVSRFVIWKMRTVVIPYLYQLGSARFTMV